MKDIESLRMARWCGGHHPPQPRPRRQSRPASRRPAPRRLRLLFSFAGGSGHLEPLLSPGRATSRPIRLRARGRYVLWTKFAMLEHEPQRRSLRRERPGSQHGRAAHPPRRHAHRRRA